mmetsp:Transcript_127238/g.368387  ORF Transcript_127238/g.368387 Transcript_127238/m.368387 type:complete len:200 (+) Transcript_127238:650-1249(+)
MVAAGAEGLLTAEEWRVDGLAREVLLVARVHEVAEELPARWGHEDGDLLLLGHEVEGARRRHGAGAALQAGLEVGDAGSVRGDDGQAVRGADEPLLAEDHVAVGIAVGSRTEVRHAGSIAHLLAHLVRAHLLHQLHSVGQVWVRMPVGRRVLATEVLLRHRIHEAGLRRAKLVHQHPLGIGALHAVHRVVDHAEVLPGN